MNLRTLLLPDPASALSTCSGALASHRARGRRCSMLRAPTLSCVSSREADCPCVLAGREPTGSSRRFDYVLEYKGPSTVYC
jgi:hypothetical protein